MLTHNAMLGQHMLGPVSVRLSEVGVYQKS